MITAKIVVLFFSLPFFKSFSISDEAYSALRDMISFLYQLDQFSMFSDFCLYLHL